MPTQFKYQYNANNSWGQCSKVMDVNGFEPDADGKYPIFVYVHATYAEWASDWIVICKRAAELGFVAMAPRYQSSWTIANIGQIEQHARCMFTPSLSSSAMTKLLTRPKADPSKGIVVLGFSQGSAIAGFSPKYEPRVRANLLWGFNGPDIPASQPKERGGTRGLPDNAIRVHDGEAELDGDYTVLDSVLGQPPANSSLDHLRPDGSGYYIVPSVEVADGVADHCWMQRNGCSGDASEPSWLPGTSNPWSLDTGLEWLKTFVTP